MEYPGYFMTYALEAHDMVSELYEADNGDLFFLSKSNDGKVGVNILNQNLDKEQNEKKDGCQEPEYERFTICEDQTIKTDILRNQRVGKYHEDHLQIKSKIQELLKKDQNQKTRDEIRGSIWHLN